MSDLTFTGGSILEQVHFKVVTVEVPPMAYLSAWVQVAIDEIAPADRLGPFDGPPAAEARITRVGNHLLGESIHGTQWRSFGTCPTVWQGFPDGDRELEVTLRTRHATAIVTVHVQVHPLLRDTTTVDHPRPVLTTA